MAGALWERRSGAAATATLALLLALVPNGPRAAAAEDGAIILAQGTFGSVVADLDGDGAREVVALRIDPDDRAVVRVAAWGMRDGRWRSLGSALVVRWAEGDVGGVRAVQLPTDGVGLLVVARDGDPRVLVASSPDDGDEFPGGCCLGLSEVVLTETGVGIIPLMDDLGPAESLQVVDFEDDGTDELVVTQATRSPTMEPPSSDYAVLRQSGAAFALEPIALPESRSAFLAVAADSDGVPGDDLVFMSDDLGLVRVAATETQGVLGVEVADTAVLGLDWRLGGWFAGAIAGRLVAVDEDGISLIAWPRGGAATRAGSVEADEYPSVFVLGDGDDARLVELDGLSGAGGGSLGLRVYDVDLRLERYLPAPEILNVLWDVAVTRSSPAARPMFPQVGPVPGGLGDGGPALLGLGSLVAIEPDGSLRVQRVPPLVGIGIMGVAGVDGAWLAHGGDWFGSGAHAYLGAFRLEEPDTTLVVMPLTTLFDPTAGSATVTHRGATEVGTGVDRRLVAPDGGFEVIVDAPAGSFVVTSAGTRVDIAEVAYSPVTLVIDHGGRGGGNRSFEAAVIVVSPGGVVSGARWDAEILREPPEVTANVAAEPFSLRATVFGRVTNGASVTVDGQPVETNRNGAYRVEVDAPIWPREVQVAARDPIGNEAVGRVEVIGFIDYRGLPWIPIMATLTVVAGVVLFLRTPRLRPAREAASDGDGLLEELDADLSGARPAPRR